MKEALTSAPILISPDIVRSFELHTSWAKVCLGVDLSHKDNADHEYVLARANRRKPKAEGNKSSNKGKALAVVHGVTHFRHYLNGKTFKLITDNQYLEWVVISDKMTRKHARKILIFSGI